MPEEVDDLVEGAVLRQGVDVVAPIEQPPLLPVDEADGGGRGDHAFEPGLELRRMRSPGRHAVHGPSLERPPGTVNGIRSEQTELGGPGEGGGRGNPGCPFRTATAFWIRC